MVATRVTRERAHQFYLREGFSLDKTSHIFEKPTCWRRGASPGLVLSIGLYFRAPEDSGRASGGILDTVDDPAQLAGDVGEPDGEIARG